MRRLLLAGLTVLAISSCGYKKVPKQGPDITDQPIKINYELITEKVVSTLNLEDGLKKKLMSLGDSLHNEIILCLEGSVDEERVQVDSFYMPPLLYSNSTGAGTNERCSSKTVARWHNHPRNNNKSKNDCYLSSDDIINSIEEDYYIPIQMVQIKDGYCWWTLKQIQERKDNITIWPLEGQFWFKEEDTQVKKLNS